ncbi:MAG: 2-amino-4-hydroxy-6-hydroxymethyldihydropteridine diphosphokinase [Mucinivorans sp.]
MARATLLLGSNLGQSHALLNKATSLIQELAGPMVDLTPIEQTAPWGMAKGTHDFFNQIVVINTSLAPLELLDVLENIERALGRTHKATTWRAPRREYASRTMDIDILYYDFLTMDSPRLALPHPRISEREFVTKLLLHLKEH